MERLTIKNSNFSFSLLVVALSALGAVSLVFAATTKRTESADANIAPTSPSLNQFGGRGDVWAETVAGAEPGYRDGAAWEARFCGPNALALEGDGGLLICDSRNHRLRRLTPAGQVETVAGGASAAGKGGATLGPSSAAQFRYPSGVTVGKQGTIYVADTGNHRICRIERGVVSLVAGGTRGLRDGTGSAAAFNSPGALCLGPDGALWLADLGNKKIRRVDLSSGVTTTPASAPASVLTSLGDLSAPDEQPQVTVWVTGYRETWSARNCLRRRSPGCTVAMRSPSADGSLTSPNRAEGEVPNYTGAIQFFGDPESGTIVAVRAPEKPMVLAGLDQEAASAAGTRDGAGAQATFAAPAAVVWSPNGLYVADYDGNRIRRIRLPQWVLSPVKAPGEIR